MTASSPAPKPRRWRLQFSLRLLLLAFTAFAIGFPIWYRWPYEETEPISFSDDPFAQPVGSVTRTWQRTWGGGRVQAGREASEITQGRSHTKTIRYYMDGKLHGPFASYSQGKLNQTGQYERGQREGTWVDYDEISGKLICTANWRQDRLDGPYEIVTYGRLKFDPSTAGSFAEAPRQRMTFLFSKGRLIDAAGQPVQNRLLEQLESAAIDEPQLIRELGRLMVGMEFIETPLRDTVLFLQDAHNLAIVLDVQRVSKIDRPITMYIKGVDLCSGLMMLTSPENLAFEYRYGVLFLTTPEHARDSRDPTGVADIRLPSGSPLARAWNEPCAIQAVEVPLDQALQTLGQPLAIGFDLTPLQARGISTTWPVTKSLKNLPFKHVLALTLDEMGLRCEAGGNDTLVIQLQK